MIEFGETLRKAREAKGLTHSQVAERTHLMVQQIDALEREDFSRIAAPIYGRGFVKLYCETLGLDPKPFIDEFMAIYTGTREPTIKMRKPAPPPEKHEMPQDVPDLPEEPAGAPVAAPEPAPAAQPPRPAPAPAAPAPASRPAPASVFAEDDPPLAQPQREKRYAPVYGDDDDDEDGFHFSVPPALWRFLALGAAAALILWLLFSFARFLYNASMGSGGEEAAEEERVEAAPAPAAETPQTVTAQPAAVKRKPIKVAPLYID